MPSCTQCTYDADTLLCGLCRSCQHRPGFPAMKVCAICDIAKPRGCFNRANKRRDGLNCYCRECCREQTNTGPTRSRKEIDKYPTDITEWLARIARLQVKTDEVAAEMGWGPRRVGGEPGRCPVWTEVAAVAVGRAA